MYFYYMLVECLSDKNLKLEQDKTSIEIISYLEDNGIEDRKKYSFYYSMIFGELLEEKIENKEDSKKDKKSKKKSKNKSNGKSSNPVNK